VLSRPGAALLAINELRQRPRQQPGELLLIDPPVSQRGIQRAVAAAELRHRRQLDQRRHRVIGAQDRIGQLEQGVRPGGQALIQPDPELPQRLAGPVPRDRVRDLGRIRRLRCRPGQDATGIQDGLQLAACSWDGIQHRPFPSSLWMCRNTQHEGNGRTAHRSSAYARTAPLCADMTRIQVKT
jgi:hypothetical protein